MHLGEVEGAQLLQQRPSVRGQRRPQLRRWVAQARQSSEKEQGRVIEGEPRSCLAQQVQRLAQALRRRNGRCRWNELLERWRLLAGQSQLQHPHCRRREKAEGPVTLVRRSANWKASASDSAHFIGAQSQMGKVGEETA